MCSCPLGDHVPNAGDKDGVQAASGTHEGLVLKPAAADDVKKFNKERNVRDIPVGLPFTEMVKRAQNFSVTKLATDVADYRETWMQPMQVCIVLRFLNVPPLTGYIVWSGCDCRIEQSIKNYRAFKHVEEGPCKDHR